MLEQLSTSVINDSDGGMHRSPAKTVTSARFAHLVTVPVSGTVALRYVVKVAVQAASADEFYR